MPTPIYNHLLTLSEPLRVRLLGVLEQEELGVGELARILQSPQSTISRHLKLLHERGWLTRRRVGTASLFSLAEPRSQAIESLWTVVRDDLDGTYSEDLHRLQAVLAQRPVDSRDFFSRLGGDWVTLRQELYGSAFLLPTLLALLPGDQVVADLGCGAGGILAELSPVVDQVIGVDREATMLDAARRRTAGRDNVTLLQGPLEALPLEDDCMDVALCMLVLHHVRDPVAVLSEAARVLRPGGRLVVLDMDAHDRQEYLRTMGHLHLGFSEEQFRRFAAEAGLALRTRRLLPADPQVQGPSLFLAVLRSLEPGRQAPDTPVQEP